MNTDLERLTSAVNRDICFDDDLAECAKMLLSGGVPSEWNGLCYVDKGGSEVPHPGLWIWLNSFQSGHQFFTTWSVEGTVPQVVDPEAFLDPLSLFHAELDTVCLTKGLPFSELRVMLCAVPPDTDQKKLCYNTSTHLTGLYIIGAEFNFDLHMLVPPSTANHVFVLPQVYMTCQTDVLGLPIPHKSNPRRVSVSDREKYYNIESAKKTVPVAKLCSFPLSTTFDHRNFISVMLPTHPSLDTSVVKLSTRPW